MKFTKEEKDLCKRIVKKWERKIEYGDWFLNEGEFAKVWSYRRDCKRIDIIPLWSISNCLEFLEKKGVNHIFNFMRFKNGNWRFTAEDNKYRKLWGEGKTRLEACLKPVLTVLVEGK